MRGHHASRRDDPRVIADSSTKPDKTVAPGTGTAITHIPAGPLGELVGSRRVDLVAGDDVRNGHDVPSKRQLQAARRQEGAVGALVLGGPGEPLRRRRQGVLLDDQPPRPPGVAQDGEEGVDVDIARPEPRERLP